MDGLTISTDVDRADFYRTMLAADGVQLDNQLRALMLDHYDLDVMFGAFQHGRLVGTVGLRYLTLTMPGGSELDVVGIGQGGVLPDATRRGVLRKLMMAVLAHAKENGAALSIATTTGWGLYGRYGYGPATVRARHVIAASKGVNDGFYHHNCEITTAPLTDDVVRWLIEAHDSSRRRTGAVRRSSAYWDFRCGLLRAGRSLDLSVRRPTYANSVVVRCLRGERQVGAAMYSFGHDDDGRRIIVHDVMAEDDGAEARLWLHLIGLNPVDEIVMPHGPLDLQVPWLLRDGRESRCVAVEDHMWVRVIDVAKCIEARSFVPVTRALAIRVSDPLGLTPAATLAVAPDGVHVTPANLARDSLAAELDIAELGSLLMGATMPTQRLTYTHQAGQTQQIGRAFAHWREPFADSQF